MLNFLKLFLFIFIGQKLVYSFSFPLNSLIKSTGKLNMIPQDNIQYFYNFQDSLLINGIGYSFLKDSSQKSLTKNGLVHSSILGVGLWTLLGFQAYLFCVSYLILGSIVTKIGIEEKEKLGIAEKREGMRGPENVWGSAGVAMICAMLTFIYRENPEVINLLKIGYASSLVTKLSDTFQSEIGKVYGKTTLLITTLEPVPKGTEGAISLEGYCAGIVGSIILSVIAYFLNIISYPNDIAICTISSILATTSESFIGATSQNKINWLNNELVNFINTFIGCILAISIYSILNY